jgi:hypothetical protein
VKKMNAEKRKLVVGGLAAVGVCQVINSMILYGFSSAYRIFWDIPLVIGLVGVSLLAIAIYFHKFK